MQIMQAQIARALGRTSPGSSSPPLSGSHSPSGSSGTASPTWYSPVRCVTRYPSPPSVAPQVSSPSPQSSSQSPQQPSALPPQATADPEGAGFRSADPVGATCGGVGVGAESVPPRGSGAGGAGVGADPGGATTGGDTTGGAGAPPTGPRETGIGRVAAGGAGSGGGATGALESGPGATTAPDTTPPPYPYPTRHQAPAGATAAGGAAAGASAGAAATAAAGTAEAAAAAAGAAVAAATSASCLSSSDPRSPLSPLLSPPLSHAWTSRSPRARPSSLDPLTHLRTVMFRPSPPRSSPSMLPSPPESTLTGSLSTPVTDYYRTFRPILSRVLASLVTDPCASLSSVSNLTAAVTEFASTRRLDYSTRLVAAPPTSPLAVGGESALSCDALEDWEFKLEVKRPPRSPLLFKARYMARGFSQCEGVDFFQTFAPTSKMTTLWVLLRVAAQRDYELHSLDFSTAFLQGSLHEEVWLCRPSAFTGTFPPGTQWRLRRLVYGLRQVPREWHDTLRSTLSDLGFQPSSADPSLFIRRGSTPFFVVVYADDLVFATVDRVALADVIHRFELQHSTVQRTPLDVDHRFTGPFPDEPFEPSGPYTELVGCLMYLMTCTRPDLAFPLSILACFVALGRHRPVHWTATVRVAKYLATTLGVGLVLGGGQSVVLTGHCDSSYADNAETHRSTHPGLWSCFVEVHAFLLGLDLYR
ncbi:unnamed protein product [Closterium sp. NIES-53]